MKIYSEKAIRDFEFWSGAKDRAEMLTLKELDAVESELEDLYPEGMDETELNDLFRFDFGSVCEMAGLEYDEKNDEIKRDEDANSFAAVYEHYVNPNKSDYHIEYETGAAPDFTKCIKV